MNIVDYKIALKTLESGLPIIFPTDTLPAIGCLPKFSNVMKSYIFLDIRRELNVSRSDRKEPPNSPRGLFFESLL